MKPNRLFRQRRGSITLSFLGGLVFVVISGLIFVTIFFGIYCFKQWQVNRRSARAHVAQQAPQKRSIDPRWPSPDGRLAFKPPPIFSWGRKTLQLVNRDTGQALAEFKVKGRITDCKWRKDGNACAFEEQLRADRSEVVLLLIQGDRVTRCRPADVIEPDRFLPAGDRQLLRHWEHSVGLLGFRDNGDLQIDWLGMAQLTPHDQPVRMTRVVYQFRIGYTPAGDVFLVESFPM
jgi:hypothetical protein